MGPSHVLPCRSDLPHFPTLGSIFGLFSVEFGPGARRVGPAEASRNRRGPASRSVIWEWALRTHRFRFVGVPCHALRTPPRHDGLQPPQLQNDHKKQRSGGAGNAANARLGVPKSIMFARTNIARSQVGAALKGQSYWGGWLGPMRITRRPSNCHLRVMRAR